jgi:precorrin-6x reductase
MISINSGNEGANYLKNNIYPKNGIYLIFIASKNIVFTKKHLQKTDAFKLILIRKL